MAVEHLAQRARLVEDAWAAAWASLGDVGAAQPTLVDYDAACLRVYTPGAPEMLLNLVMCYNAPGPVTSDAIERVIAPYRLHKLPFQWWTTSGLEPVGLREQLRALGMQTWGGATSMTLDLPAWQPHLRPAPRATQVSRAHTREDATQALRVICEVFYLQWEPMARWTIDNPVWRMYLARLDGQPVAALSTLWRDEVAFINNVATLSGVRRQGIAGALLAHALHEAREAGCVIAALTATAEARRLYEDIGFSACGLLQQWAPGAELNAALVSARRMRLLHDGARYPH